MRTAQKVKTFTGAEEFSSLFSKKMRTAQKVKTFAGEEEFSSFA